ncbi:MAG TPA: acyltransferase [Acidimicrobiales bacterium]|nr:acyltransferase [Acidimicrobiales bacterium]
MEEREQGDDAPRRLGHRPALDGIRGIAWGIVFCSHAFVLPLAIGQSGMFVFFALSGFLITGLLVGEHFRTGGVSLTNFFARRALRLLPALVFFLAGWLLVVLATRGTAPWTTTVPGGIAGTGTSPWSAFEGAGAALLYVTNWAEIWDWFTGYVPLGHLWSLAVEEQFYLLWSPLAVLLLWRRGRAAVGWAAAIAALASFVDVALRSHAALTLRIDMSSDTRAGAFLVGAALAVAWSRRARWLRVVEAGGGRFAIAGSLLVLGWGSWVFDQKVSVVLFMTTWVAVSVAAGLLVVAYLGDATASRHGMVHSPVATYVGRRSYGLYLWHYVWLTWLAGLGLFGVPLALVATFAAAEVSWRLVERPALGLKRRFTSIPAMEAAVERTPTEKPLAEVAA